VPSPFATQTRGIRPIVVAQLVSVTGTQVSMIALPAVAVLVLRASPLAVSALFAISYAAQAASAPFAGVLVDSARSRRALLVVVESLHAVVMAAVPAGRAIGLLGLPLLFAAGVASGVLGGNTTVAVRAALARAVPAQHAVAANSAVAGSRAIGQIAGPALAGWLIQVLDAVSAVTADAASYAVSALIFLRLRVPAEPGPPRRDRQSLREGMALLAGQPALVRIAVADAALNVGGAALGALYIVYVFRYLRLAPAALGVTLMVQNGAAVLAVASADRVSRRIGLRRVVPVFAPAAAASLLLIPAASVLPPLATLVVYGAIFGYCATLWSVGSAALQQILIPPRQLGRVVALSRTAGLVAIPVGAALGGLVAQGWGVVQSLVVFALVALACTTAAAHGAGWRTGPRRAGEPALPERNR
jgi:MFS family permease